MTDTEKLYEKIDYNILKFRLENKLKLKLIRFSNNISIIQNVLESDISAIPSKKIWLYQNFSLRDWVPLNENKNKKTNGMWLIQKIVRGKMFKNEKTLNKDKVITILEFMAKEKYDTYFTSSFIEQIITRVKNEKFYRYLIDYSNINKISLDYNTLRLILTQKCSGNLLVPIYDLKYISVNTKLALISAHFKGPELATMESLVGALQKKINNSKA